MKHLNLNLNKTLSPNSNIVLSSQQAIKSYIDSKKVFVQFLQESTPTTFKAGDKWVNTASNKLFIATNDTTWDNGSNLDITAIYSFGNLLYHYNGTDTKCYSTTSITEQNANKEIKEWFGTQDEYNAIETKDENTHYIIIDDVSTSSSLLATQEEFNSSVTDKAATPKQVNEKIGNYLPLAGGNLDKGAILRFTNTNNQVSSMSLDENKYITMSDNLKVSGDINTNSLVSTTGNIYKGNSSGAINIWSDSFATTEKAGVIKVGNNLTIAEDGTLNAEAGGGGTKRSIGEVYFSQSALATDNSGALPLFTGETIASANTIYPEFYSWVTAHTELQCTAEEYESTLTTYGECPKYAIKFPVANTVYKYNLTGLSNALESQFSFYIKNENDEYVTIEDKVYYYTNEEFIIEPLKSNEPTIFLDEKCTQKIYTEYHSTGGEQAYYEVKLTLSGPSKVRLKIDISDVAGVFIAPSTGSVTPSTIKNTETILTVTTYVSNGSLRLPKLSNFIKMAELPSGVITVAAGLPDHTHYLATSSASGTWGGGEYLSQYGDTGGAASYQLMGTSNEIPSIFKSSEASNTIYGKSDTVTPPSTTLYPWVVAYTTAIPASTAQAAEFQSALSGKADTNLGNVASNIDYVVESYSDASGNWYRKYKSGWLEQGGIYKGTFNMTSVHNLLVPFANTTYSILGEALDTYDYAVSWCARKTSFTTTSFTGEGFRGTTGNYTYNTLRWEAKGQGAN